MSNPTKVSVLELVASEQAQVLAPPTGQGIRSLAARVLQPRPVAIAFIGIVFLLMYMLSYPRSFGGDQTFNSPRENVGYLLSQRFANGDGFRYPLAHFDELRPDVARALTPRDAAEIDGVVVPKDFAGTMLVYAPFFVLWPPIVLLITPFFAVASGVALYKLGKELFDWRVGMASYVVWLAYPAFFVNASFIFTSDTIALFLMITGALFFFKYWRAGTRADLLWMVGALGCATIMRYPNVIVAAALVVVLLEARKITWKDAGYAMAVIAPLAAVPLLFNRMMYGGFTVTGFHLGASLLAETANFTGESFLKFRPEVIAGYLKKYLIGWPIMLLPQVLGVGAGLYFAWARPTLRAPLLAFLGAGGLLAFYYLPQDAWGWTSPQVSASLLRYLMPVLAVATVFFCAATIRITERYPLIAAAGLLLLLGAYGWTTWNGPGGVRETREVVASIQDVHDDVVHATETDAIVATRIMDKVIFPDRQTMTLTYLLDNDEPISKGRQHTWQFLPNGNRFAEVGAHVYEHGISLYLLADFHWTIAKEYDEALQERGYRLRNMRTAYPEFDDVNFYKIVPLDKAATR